MWLPIGQRKVGANQAHIAPQGFIDPILGQNGVDVLLRSSATPQ